RGGQLRRAHRARRARWRLPALHRRLGDHGRARSERLDRHRRWVHVRPRSLARRTGAGSVVRALALAHSARLALAPVLATARRARAAAGAVRGRSGGRSMNAELNEQVAARPRTPQWLAMVIAVLFGLFFAYDVW